MLDNLLGYLVIGGGLLCLGAALATSNHSARGTVPFGRLFWSNIVLALFGLSCLALGITAWTIYADPPRRMERLPWFALWMIAAIAVGCLNARLHVPDENAGL